MESNIGSLWISKVPDPFEVRNNALDICVIRKVRHAPLVSGGVAPRPARRSACLSLVDIERLAFALSVQFRGHYLV